MAKVTVSVTCPNCGTPVVLTLDTKFAGGFSQCCYNCSRWVCGSYSWGGGNQPIIRDVHN